MLSLQMFIGRNRDDESVFIVILCHIFKGNWIFVKLLICDSYIVIQKAVNYILAPLHPPHNKNLEFIFNMSLISTN